MRHLIALIVGLVMLWLVLSGHYTAITLGLGGVSCVFTAWLCARMGLVSAEAVPISLLPRLLLYVPWLLWRVIHSNLLVSLHLVGLTRRVEPGLVRLALPQRTALGQAIFANSVTLTPGTAAIGLENGTALIHSLTYISHDEIANGVMNRRACWLEGRPGD